MGCVHSQQQHRQQGASRFFSIHSGKAKDRAGRSSSVYTRRDIDNGTNLAMGVLCADENALSGMHLTASQIQQRVQGRARAFSPVRPSLEGKMSAFLTLLHADAVALMMGYTKAQLTLTVQSSTAGAEVSGLDLEGMWESMTVAGGARPLQRHEYARVVEGVTVLLRCVGDRVNEDTDTWDAVMDIVVSEMVFTNIIAGSAEALVVLSAPSWLFVVGTSQWHSVTVFKSGFWDTYDRESYRKTLTNKTITVNTRPRDGMIWEHTYIFRSTPGCLCMRLQFMLVISGDQPSAPVASTDSTLFEEVEVGSLLGRGGFGQVYRGLWQGRVVAVKVVDNADVTKEAEIGMHLDHPNIVRTYATARRELDMSEVQTIIVLELCEGGSLRQAIESGLFSRVDGTVDTPKVLLVLLDIARGMAHLHSQRILHGDLSLNNILLDANMRAKVSDLGLSRIYSGKTVVTRTHGTVTHMSPEVLLSGTLSLASDVYSFGIIMCELYSPTRLYADMTHLQIVTKKFTEHLDELMSSQMPSDLMQIAASCLKKEYHERPSFVQVIDVLEKTENNRVCSIGASGENLGM